MTRLRTFDGAVTWLITILVGILAGYLSMSFQGGTCRAQTFGSPSLAARFQSAMVDISRSVPDPATSPTSVVGKEQSTSEANTAPPRRQLVAESGSGAPRQKTGEMARKDPFAPLVVQRGSPDAILSPGRALLVSPRSPLPADVRQSLTANAGQPSLGRLSGAGTADKVTRRGPSRVAVVRKATFHTLLEAMVVAISAEADVLEKENTSALAGRSALGSRGEAQLLQNAPSSDLASPQSITQNPHPSAEAAAPKLMGLSTASPARRPKPPMSLPRPTRKSDMPLRQVMGGPIYDRKQVEAIVKQLMQAGFMPRVSASDEGEPERFRVVSESLLSSVAEHRAAGLADLHPDREVLDNGRVKLQFGVYPSEQDAKALMGRIRTRGYFATLERAGGTSYTINLNLSQQVAVDASVDIIHVSGVDVPIRIDLVP